MDTKVHSNCGHSEPLDRSERVNLSFKETPIMTLEVDWFSLNCPCTTTLRRVFSEAHNTDVEKDLLFLERGELAPLPGPAAALRVTQIRRANPELAAAIRHELRDGLPSV